MSESDWLFICQAGLSQTSLCQIESLSTWQAVYGRWSSRKSSCDTKVTGQTESPKSESNLTHWLSSALSGSGRYWIRMTRFWGEFTVGGIWVTKSLRGQAITILGTAAALLWCNLHYCHQTSHQNHWVTEWGGQAINWDSWNISCSTLLWCLVRLASTFPLTLVAFVWLFSTVHF